MSESKHSSDDSSREHSSHSGRRSSGSHSRKSSLMSGRLGGGRIGGGDRSSTQRSSSSQRSRDDSRRRDERQPREERVVAEKPKVKRASSKSLQPRKAQGGRSWLMRRLSFAGFSYNRLTKKDGWVIFRRFCIGAVPLLVLAFGAHVGTLAAGRLWLDQSLIGRESLINSPDGVLHVWLSTIEGEYAPLSWFFMWLEHWIWGVEGNGYHILNLLLHVFNAILVWRLCRNLNLTPPAPWFAGAFFAVHPLCFPAVGWIFARGILLTTTFSLASLNCFFNYDKPNSDDLPSGYLLASVIFAFFASLCHAGIGLALPLVALGTMGLRRGTKVSTGFRHLSRCLPLAIGVLPVLGLSLFFAWRSRPLAGPSLSWLEQAQQAGWLAWRAVWRWGWPSVPFLDAPGGGVSTTLAILPLIVAFCLLIGLYFGRRMALVRPVFFWFWPFFFIALGTVAVVPYAGAFRHGLVAGHLAYGLAVPLAAFAAGLLVAIFKPLAEKTSLFANLTGLVLVGVLLTATVVQSSILRSRERLWAQVIERAPQAVLGHVHYARELIRQDRLLEALPVLRRAVAIKPDHAALRNLLGQALLDIGEVEEAREHFRVAFEQDPSLREGDIERQLNEQLETAARNPQGLIHFLNIQSLPRRGRSEILDYDELAFMTGETALGPRIREAYLAIKNGDLQTAGRHVGTLLQKEPQGAIGNYLAGYLAFQQSQYREVIHYLQIAVREQTNLAGAYYYLGRAYAEEGDYPQAQRAFLAATSLQPKMTEAFYWLATGAEKMGRDAEAIEFYVSAMLISPHHVDALRACADILATHPLEELRNGKQALELAQKAILHAAEPTTELLATLSAAYAEAGFMRDAVRTARRGLRKAETEAEKIFAQARLEAFEKAKPYRREMSASEN